MELVLYDQMCAAIAQCAAVDEAAGIKDKAAQFQAYAKMCDNPKAEREFAEVKLRSSIRIGELSRDLETAKNQYARPNDRTSKIEILEEAGISRSTANDYEQLTGGREEQAQKVANNAAEVYFAEQKQNEEVPTMGGLKAAIESALVKTLGEPPKRTKKSKEEIDHRFIHFIGPIRDFQRNRGEYDPAFFAAEEMEFIAKSDIQGCEDFILLVQQFIEETRKRFNHVF